MSNIITKEIIPLTTGNFTSPVITNLIYQSSQGLILLDLVLSVNTGGNVDIQGRINPSGPFASLSIINSTTFPSLALGTNRIYIPIALTTQIRVVTTGLNVASTSKVSLLGY